MLPEQKGRGKEVKFKTLSGGLGISPKYLLHLPIFAELGFQLQTHLMGICKWLSSIQTQSAGNWLGVGSAVGGGSPFTEIVKTQYTKVGQTRNSDRED